MLGAEWGSARGRLPVRVRVGGVRVFVTDKEGAGQGERVVRHGEVDAANDDDDDDDDGNGNERNASSQMMQTLDMSRRQSMGP